MPFGHGFHKTGRCPGPRLAGGMKTVERTMSSVLDAIKEAGLVGEGGAGFPTHVKLACKAEVVIGNGLECEPMLRTDRLIMERWPEKVAAGLRLAMEATGASKGVIALKNKYHAATDALKSVIQNEPSIKLHLMDSFYPAGDEQEIVYEVTGKRVPAAGLPIDVGAVIQNVGTLVHIAEAAEGKPFTEKLVTVNGEVGRPAVYLVPIGTPIKLLIEASQGPRDLSNHTLVIGGPAMGRLSKNIDEVVQKTTGGVLVFSDSHPLIQKKTGTKEMDWKLAKAVCCQCMYCTLMCPRNALGLNVQPHKVMRALAAGAPKSIGDPQSIFSCCDCGLCTYYACNFQLAPSRVMQYMKQELAKQGMKPQKREPAPVPGNMDDIKVPTHRLTMRLGIEKYDKDLPLIENGITVTSIKLPLRMHIGAPSEPLVKAGDRVEKGQLVARAAGNVSANLHASIGGTIASVSESAIEIRVN